MAETTITRSDKSEIFEYDFAGFPVLARKDRMSHYVNRTASEHWHDDFEFILALSGGIDAWVNGKRLRVGEGQGIFVNSKQLHSYNCPTSDCTYICVLVHPSLLSASRQLSDKFVIPVSEIDGVPYVLLDGEVGWQQSVMDMLRQVYQSREQETAPLRIQSLIYRVWLTLYEEVFSKQEHRAAPKTDDRGLSTVKRMVSYIQQNYRERVTLDEIAEAGMVGRTTCRTLFRKFLNDTPVNYLIRYRLKMAAELLGGTDTSVSEIASETGFSTTSYFIEVFHHYYGKSPLEYRRGA